MKNIQELLILGIAKVNTSTTKLIKKKSIKYFMDVNSSVCYIKLKINNIFENKRQNKVF